MSHVCAHTVLVVLNTQPTRLLETHACTSHTHTHRHLLPTLAVPLPVFVLVALTHPVASSWLCLHVCAAVCVYALSCVYDARLRVVHEHVCTLCMYVTDCTCWCAVYKHQLGGTLSQWHCAGLFPVCVVSSCVALCRDIS